MKVSAAIRCVWLLWLLWVAPPWLGAQLHVGPQHRSLTHCRLLGGDFNRDGTVDFGVFFYRSGFHVGYQLASGGISSRSGLWFKNQQLTVDVDCGPLVKPGGLDLALLTHDPAEILISGRDDFLNSLTVRHIPLGAATPEFLLAGRKPHARSCLACFPPLR